MKLLSLFKNTNLCFLLFISIISFCNCSSFENEISDEKKYSSEKIFSENEFAENIKILPFSYWLDDATQTRTDNDSITPVFGHKYQFSYDNRYYSIRLTFETGKYPECQGWGLCYFFSTVTEYENGDNPVVVGNNVPILLNNTNNQFYIDILLANSITTSRFYPLAVTSDLTSTAEVPNSQIKFEITIIQGNYQFDPTLGINGGYRVNVELREI